MPETKPSLLSLRSAGSPEASLDHTSGCPRLRPASADQPVRPCSPAVSGLFSTWCLAAAPAPACLRTVWSRRRHRGRRAAGRRCLVRVRVRFGVRVRVKVEVGVGDRDSIRIRVAAGAFGAAKEALVGQRCAHHLHHEPRLDVRYELLHRRPERLGALALERGVPGQS